MKSIDSIRKFWQGLYKNDLAELLTRIGLFFSAIVLINSSFTNWNRFPIGTNQTAFLLIVVAYMFGFTLIILSLLTQVRAVKFAILIPIAAGFTVALNYWVFVLWVPAYGTDALAFLHYSALLVLQGRNPFQESMLPSLQLFPIPLSNSSPLDTGQLFDGTPYPALAFLLYVPGLLVGLRDIRLVTLAFHLAAILILYFSSERSHALLSSSHRGPYPGSVGSHPRRRHGHHLGRPGDLDGVGSPKSPKGGPLFWNRMLHKADPALSWAILAGVVLQVFQVRFAEGAVQRPATLSWCEFDRLSRAQPAFHRSQSAILDIRHHVPAPGTAGHVRLWVFGPRGVQVRPAPPAHSMQSAQSLSSWSYCPP